VDICLL